MPLKLSFQSSSQNGIFTADSDDPDWSTSHKFIMTAMGAKCECILCFDGVVVLHHSDGGILSANRFIHHIQEPYECGCDDDPSMVYVL